MSKKIGEPSEKPVVKLRKGPYTWEGPDKEGKGERVSPEELMSSEDKEAERIAEEITSRAFGFGEKTGKEEPAEIRKIREKLAQGELISNREAATLREFDLMEKSAQEKETVRPPKELPLEKAEEAKEVEKPESKKEFARIIPAAEVKKAHPETMLKTDIGPGKEVTKLPPLRESRTDELEALSKPTAEEKEVIEKSEGYKPFESEKFLTKEREETELARQGAEITLSRITNYEELNAKTLQEGDEKFLQKTRQLWKEFAVHGLLGYNQAGNLTLTNETDLDGKGCLFLMKEAGFDISNLKYIKHGDYSEDRIYFDVGDVHGIVLKDGGKKVFIDHHTDESGKESSAAKFTYKLLQSLDLLKKEKYLDTLVNFVTDLDNKTYFSDEKSFRNSWKTIYGLHRYMDFAKIVELFQMGVKPGEILSYQKIKKFGLDELIRRQQKTINVSVKKMQAIEKGGLVVPSKRFGKIVVDIGKKVGAGYDAVRAFGYQTYVIWSPENKSFFITSKERLDKEKFGQGRPVRGHMWIKPRTGEELLKIKLADILSTLTDGEFKPTDRLKEFIEKEAQIVEGEKLLKELGIENLTLEQIEELEKKYLKKEA